MAQNFRSALNGFNREDVVQYLEFLNNKHNAQVKQLVSDGEFLRQQLEAASKADHTRELEELKARCQELERQLSEVQSEKAALEQRCGALQQALDEVRAQPQAVSQTDRELEAYRRAERAERLARERAGMICRQANGVLAQATAKVDDASGRIGDLSAKITAQLEQLCRAVDGSRLTLQDAADAMHQFRIDEE
ncbi:MAG: hypothetical protein SPE19_04495 [Candidatus Faecousia sp.]|nr:hypothetical protein [Candidatus Faecousia sp.]